MRTSTGFACLAICSCIANGECVLTLRNASMILYVYHPHRLTQPHSRITSFRCPWGKDINGERCSWTRWKGSDITVNVDADAARHPEVDRLPQLRVWLRERQGSA